MPITGSGTSFLIAKMSSLLLALIAAAPPWNAASAIFDMM
jgi:hypothetical protein